jgi:D-alanine-D-alanine ligase
MQQSNHSVTKFNKVAVIMGGGSSEREISLLSGNMVLEALKRSGVNAFKFDPHEQQLCDLVHHNYDAAVITLHGPKGEDGTLQGALEYFAIPYTGSSVLASSMAMDKIVTKIIWNHYQLPLARWQTLNKKDYLAHNFNLTIELPIIVKPACEGSTVGITKVYDIENLAQALSVAFEYDDNLLIEELIIGGEYSATIFNGRLYPLVKIEAPAGEYDYNNKYFTDVTRYICPAVLSDSLTKKLNEFLLKAYQVIGASGIARIDFMLNNDEQIFMLEINTIPGLTTHSLVPMAFKAAGQTFDELCLAMLNDAKLYSRNR